MPVRFPFARRAAAAASAAAVPVRRAGQWTVAPVGQDDEWLHRNRRYQLTRADGPTTLKRPAVRAASPGTASASLLVKAGPRAVTGDFSGVRAHRADPLQVPTATHVERALLSPYTRPPAGALATARRANMPVPEEIRILSGGLPTPPGVIGQTARQTTVRSGKVL